MVVYTHREVLANGPLVKAALLYRRSFTGQVIIVYADHIVGNEDFLCFVRRPPSPLLVHGHPPKSPGPTMHDVLVVKAIEHARRHSFGSGD